MIFPFLGCFTKKRFLNVFSKLLHRFLILFIERSFEIVWKISSDNVLAFKWRLLVTLLCGIQTTRFVYFLLKFRSQRTYIIKITQN